MSGSGPAAPAEAAAPVPRAARQLVRGVVALAMFAMMTVTFVDVVGRYLLSRPVPGASEWVQVLMTVLIASALPLVSATRSHITMALFTDNLKGRPRRMLDVVLHLASTGILAFLAWRMADQAASLSQSQAATLFVGIPTAPFAAGLGLMLAVTACIELRHAWHGMKPGAGAP